MQSPDLAARWAEAIDAAELAMYEPTQAEILYFACNAEDRDRMSLTVLHDDLDFESVARVLPEVGEHASPSRCTEAHRRRLGTAIRIKSSAT